MTGVNECVCMCWWVTSTAIERQGLYTPPPEESEVEVAGDGSTSSGGTFLTDAISTPDLEQTRLPSSELEAKLQATLRSMNMGPRAAQDIESEVRKMHAEMDEIRTKYLNMFDGIKEELKGTVLFLPPIFGTPVLGWLEGKTRKQRC